MLSLQKVNYHYPGSEFCLTIPQFEMADRKKIAIIGPSGSGKTTLMNAIAGIIVPDQGVICHDETIINKFGDNERRKFRLSNIGFIFQDFSLIDYLSVFDNILHPYRISNTLILNGEVRERALTLSQSLGIDKLLEQAPTKLSQGEKQRVAICRAMVTQPQLILADEATGNLDPDNKLKILELLFSLVDQDNASLIAVTHDHALLTHFDQVMTMDQLAGKVA